MDQFIVMLIAMGERQLAKVCWYPFFLPKAGSADSGDAKLKVSVNSRGVMRYDWDECLVSDNQGVQLAATEPQPLGYGYDRVGGLKVLHPRS